MKALQRSSARYQKLHWEERLNSIGSTRQSTSGVLVVVAAAHMPTRCDKMVSQFCNEACTVVMVLMFALIGFV